jgi:hypothetical protein
MLIILLFIIAPNKHSPNAHQLVNKLWHTHAMEYYSTIKRSNLLIKEPQNHCVHLKFILKNYNCTMQLYKFLLFLFLFISFN